MAVSYMAVQKGCWARRMGNYNRQEQLKCLHKQRRAATEQKANDAIDYLLKIKRPVNFKQVSEQSGISIATLYKHESIKQRISALRGCSVASTPARAAKTTMNDSGKDAIIASLKRRIDKLEQENIQLRNQINSHIAKEWESL